MNNQQRRGRVNGKDYEIVRLVSAGVGDQFVLTDPDDKKTIFVSSDQIRGGGALDKDSVFQQCLKIFHVDASIKQV